MAHYFGTDYHREPTVESTDELAEAFHRQQLYGREPYIQHVRRVARRLAAHGEWAVMAGLLHDIVEDTAMELAGLRELRYPEIVVEAVDAVTCRDGEDYYRRVRIAAAHPLGCLVKLADNQDNYAMLATLAEHDPERSERLRGRYTRAREILQPAFQTHSLRGPTVFDPMVFGPPMSVPGELLAEGECPVHNED
jgi:(p)ppGpp synthase/HD superfamily hydrolase